MLAECTRVGITLPVMALLPCSMLELLACLICRPHVPVQHSMQLNTDRVKLHNELLHELLVLVIRNLSPSANHFWMGSCAQEHEKSIISRGINAIRGALKGNHNHGGEAAGPAGAPLPAPSGPQVRK